MARSAIVRGFSPMISAPARPMAAISASFTSRPQGLPRMKPRSPSGKKSGFIPNASRAVTRWMVLRMSEMRTAARFSTSRESSSGRNPVSRDHSPM
ncbi:MAG: hypothetical protein AUI15_14055 [Actinobacteria bacterium 13_2_20CM_2_66_6]|nr:MAG: hypothetical protein AUI15_14055 [Actinobacteria bacterium 13_2_20CM_2_66_6]